MLYIWLGPVVALLVVAQDSSNVPNCTNNQYDWTFNSLGQNPCYVADVLSDQCTGQNQITSLPAGGSYAPIGSSFANFTCLCNTVWYSLVSACAACQNGSWSSWPPYSQKCNQTYVMQYPNPVPSNTSVPDWAYLNVTATNDTFNLVAASGLAGPTYSSTSSAPASTSNSTSGSSTSDAIIGGLVIGIGGLVAGLFVAAFVLWLRRRYKRYKPIADTPHVNNRGIKSVPPSLAESESPSSLLLRPLSAESSTSMQPMYLQALQDPYDADETTTLSPTDEVLSVRRSLGQSLSRKDSVYAHSIQTNSSATWFSERE